MLQISELIVKVLFFLLMVVGSFSGFTQEKNPYFISTQSKLAFILPHRAAISHLPKDINKTFEISLSQQVINSPWSSIYKAPVRGLCFTFQDYGNPTVLGQGFTISQFASFPLFETKKGGFLDFRASSGLAYLTKKFDVETNPKNNAIGSHLNGYVNFQFSWIQYFRKWHIGGGIDFAHYSNSAVIKPNLGLNTPGILFILGYNPAPRKSMKQELGEMKNFAREEDQIKNAFNFTWITTTKQNLPGQTKSRNLPVFAIQSIYSHNLNAKWNLETGIDIIYDAANRVKYDDREYSAVQTLQVGGYVGVAANLFKTQIYFGLGAYMYNFINPAGYLYNRIGYRYHFNKRWNMMIGIMANLGIADYLEFGVGYRIECQKKGARK